MRWYSRYLADRAADAGEPAGPDVELAGDVDTPREVLASAGIRVPTETVVGSEDDAVEAVRRLDGPAVLKLHRPAVDHKSDIGGVRVNMTEANARAEYRQLIQDVESALGDGIVEAVVVQEMVPAGVEILAGVHRDDEVGPVLTVGLGGVLTELFADVAIAPVPVTRPRVRRMLESLRCWPLLAGFRGGPAADVDALVDTVLRLVAVAQAVGDGYREIELNPVLVRPRGMGVVAVDWVFG